MTHFIGGQWHQGSGTFFQSHNPATDALVWEGREASAAQVDGAVTAAKTAFEGWAFRRFEERQKMVEAYRDLMAARKAELAKLISEENGKALWDATLEAGATANKIDISVQAYHDRTPTTESVNGAVRTRLTHRPHGVMAVFGPYNFPAHLANGHIVPALLAGNTVVFKPSELTPNVAEFMVRTWEEAGLPAGVINLVQGGRSTGEALVADARLAGVLFTGSVTVGQQISRQLADRPWVIQALELGGNNPLIVTRVRDPLAAAHMTIQSAYITSGQRCTCARRLIVPSGVDGDEFIETLKLQIKRIIVGAADSAPEPFMGPLIHARAARSVLAAQDSLIDAGGVPLIKAAALPELGPAFVSPGLIDVTGCDVPDEEIFGPFLQLKRVPDFEAAVQEANNTRFGLASGLISDDQELYHTFYPRARAGIVNWNQQLTGAASTAPFGGIGLSGNHRPSAYFAADYAAYAVASIENADGQVTAPEPKGFLPK